MANPFVLDFSPVQNALSQWQKQRQFDQAQQFQNRQFDEGVRQFGVQNALARDRFGLEQLTAERAEAKAPYDLRHKDAQINLLNQQAQYYGMNGRAKMLALQQGMMPQPDPTEGLAMKPDGELYSTQGGYQPNSGGIGGNIQANDPEYGPVGRQPVDVPGVVTTPKGVSDRYATQASEGQRALEGRPDQDRARFLEYKALQDRWGYLHGKRARPGHMYDQSGREVPIGPLTKSADDAERKDRAIGNMMGQINQAEKTLLGSWGATRAIAGGLKESGPVGRFANNIFGLEQTAAALDQYKEGVLQTVYALSGKQTTNKEMEAFLSLYMPQAGESDVLLKDKTRRLRKMLQTLQSKAKTGMVYEDAERAALTEAAGADFNKQQGRLAPEPQAPTAPKSRLHSKYGLE